MKKFQFRSLDQRQLYRVHPIKPFLYVITIAGLLLDHALSTVLGPGPLEHRKGCYDRVIMSGVSVEEVTMGLCETRHAIVLQFHKDRRL